MTTTTESPAPSALEVGDGGASRRWWWFGGISGCLLLGFAVAALLGPHAIEAAYRGDGFTFLRPLMQGRDVHPVGYYKAKLFRLGWTVVGLGIVTTAMALISTSRWFFRRFVGEATPGALALIRILACAVLLTDVLTIDLGQVAMFPPEVRLRMGVLHVLQQLPLGLDALNASAAGLRMWQALTALWLLLGLLGWDTRFALPLSLVFYVVVGGILRQYDRPGHGSLAAMYVLAILCFTPCGDAWSLDRWRRRRRGLPVAPLELPQPIYGWARYVCWVPIVLIYVEAGLTKIVAGGLYWWIAPNLRSMMLRGSIEDVEQRWTLVPEIVAAPDAVFAAVGIVTVAGEVLFFLVLFSVTARRILPLVMLGMHLGILVVLRLRFLDMLLFTLIFYDWSAIGAWLRRRFGARSSQSSPQPADTVAPAHPTTYPPDRGRLAFPLAACAIALIMLGVWRGRSSFIPSAQCTCSRASTTPRSSPITRWSPTSRPVTSRGCIRRSCSRWSGGSATASPSAARWSRPTTRTRARINASPAIIFEPWGGRGTGPTRTGRSRGSKSRSGAGTTARSPTIPTSASSPPGSR